MAKEKNPWLICLKHIILASLADFGVFVASSALLAAIFEGEDKQALRNLVAYVFMMMFYAIFFYRFREYNRISTYMEHTERFDPKGELMAFLRTDGKIVLAIYGIAAIATEISCFIFPSPTPNPIATACLFALGPFCGEIPVYVLRSLVGFVYAAAVLCGLALLRSHRIYKDDLAATARRRER